MILVQNKEQKQFNTFNAGGKSKLGLHWYYFI